MGFARAATQRLIMSPALPAVAILGGWLRLDRLFEVSWRWARRDRVRRLQPVEIHEAERVFGHSIPYEDVRIVEASPLALRIAALSGQVHLPQGKNLAVTVFYTIHFGTKLRPDNRDMPWLAHELTHVWQYCQRGPRYLTDALRAQSEYGEDAYKFEEGVAQGWAWEHFNPEQQGEIARAYYRGLVQGQDVSALQSYIDVLRRGRFAMERVGKRR
jgi:hypothetical protein